MVWNLIAVNPRALCFGTSEIYDQLNEFATRIVHSIHNNRSVGIETSTAAVTFQLFLSIFESWRRLLHVPLIFICIHWTGSQNKLEAIQRWSAIYRVWPWTVTYQKFLLCVSSQGLKWHGTDILYSHQKLNMYILLVLIWERLQTPTTTPTTPDATVQPLGRHIANKYVPLRPMPL